ncbi:hypothetical protein CMO92_02160 [Candidatus Woesearchaeota archaeon]|nr:hypothetical protein [Candidatus Woesearchaeota archaeon]
MAWFLDIADKVDVVDRKGEKLFCPPHCFPHKIMFTKPITDEPCHFRRAGWRMLHHLSFCFILRCPYRRRMKEAYKKDSK